MAITTNTLTSLDLAGLDLALPSRRGFVATRSDVNYFEDPNFANKQVASRFISLDINTDDIKVRFADDTDLTIPAGALAAGVLHPIQIVRLWSTGSGATVNVTVWL